MGLDMYLYKKSYVKNWNSTPDERKHDVSITMGGAPIKHIKPERICYIEEEVAYWRKFNALHKYFVDNYGGGNDDCQEIYISTQDLRDLLEVLNQVLGILEGADKVSNTTKDWKGNEVQYFTYDCLDQINDIFPPTDGFFFGSTDINDWFKKDVENTIEVISALIAEYEENPETSFSFYYQASW
jgi:hypothetical protein